MEKIILESKKNEVVKLMIKTLSDLGYEYYNYIPDLLPKSWRKNQVLHFNQAY